MIIAGKSGRKTGGRCRRWGIAKSRNMLARFAVIRSCSCRVEIVMLPYPEQGLIVTCIVQLECAMQDFPQRKSARNLEGELNFRWS